MIATLTRTRAGLLVGALLLGACLLLPGAARAAETLDQQQAVEDPTGYWTSIEAGFSEGQTFTAGISGSLTRVSLMLGKLNEDGSLGNLTVKIYGTSGGLPAGSPLAASTIFPDEVGPSDTCCWAWADATFSAPAALTAGRQYAIVLESDSATSYYALELNGQDPYAGGTEIEHAAEGWYGIGPYDAVFRTYVSPGASAAPTARFLDPLSASSAIRSVVNTAKNGRVVPVRVQLSQDGTPITDSNASGPVTLSVSDLGPCGGAASTEPVDVYAAGSANSSSAFRYDATSQAWVYNLNTKAMSLTSGDCYRLDVSVGGVQATGSWAVLEPVR